MTESPRTEPDETQEHAETRKHIEMQMDGNEEAATVAMAAADELAEVRAELDTHREQLRELEEKLLRRAAEFQNYRRRTQEDLAQARERGAAEVITRQLDVLDDLYRSLDAAEQAAEKEQGGPLYDTLKQGVDLVTRKFEDTLAAFNVQPIPAVGQPFDENLHEAMMRQEGSGEEAGTVLAEIQRGYAMKDRVLRHARVIVAA